MSFVGFLGCSPNIFELPSDLASRLSPFLWETVTSFLGDGMRPLSLADSKKVFLTTNYMKMEHLPQCT